MKLLLSVKDVKILESKFEDLHFKYKSEYHNLENTSQVHDPDRKPRMAFLEVEILLLKLALERIERRWLLYALWLNDASQIDAQELKKE